MPIYTRTRDRGGFVPVYTTWTSFSPFYCGADIIHWTQGMGEQGTYETISDVVTPRFKERSAAGEVIITPMEKQSTTYTCAGDFGAVTSDAESCSTTHVHNVERLAGPYAYQLVHSGNTHVEFLDLISKGDISDLVATAATKAWSNSAGHDSDVLQDFAEWHQTVGMPRGLLQQSRNAFRSLLRHDKGLRRKARSAAQVANAAQQLWLQARFGLRPLISSVNSVIDTINRMPPMLKRTTYRGRSKYKLISSSTGSAQSWSTAFTYKETYSDEVIVRAGILMEDVINYGRALGMDASGMLALPYELVPYSFVGDWFVSAGDFLYGLIPYLTKSPLGSWFTITRTQGALWEIQSSSSVGGSGYTLTQAPREALTGLRVTKTRTPSLPGPSVAWRPGSPKAVLNSWRGMDALALTLQQIGGMFGGKSRPGLI
jgi:hypothetical protein